MKKKILSGIAVVTIAVVAAFNINLQESYELSTIRLANIEALASGESGGYSCTVTRDCGGGDSVSCTGTSHCELVTGPLGSSRGSGVKCDGKVTKC